MHVPLRRCSIIAAFVVLSAFAAAQVVTGTYPYGTYDRKGLDSINLGNLNVHLSIPVLNKPGRGMPFYYNLSYDSSVWYPTSVNGSQVWQPVLNFGWRGDTEIATGYVSDHVSTTNGRLRGSDGLWYTCPTTMYSGFVYHDTFGVSHPFGGITTDTSAQPAECNPPPSQPSFTANATDGSGYTLNVTDFDITLLTVPAFTRIYDKNLIRLSMHGGQFNPPAGPSGAGNAIDSNGNEISANGTGGFTDTTGTTVLNVSSNGPAQQLFTYTDTTGTPRSVKLNYTQLTVQTNFGCSNIGEYGPTSMYLVTSIVFPDNSTYTIQYEQTPGFQSSVTGRIASVTLPQGGTITYTYSNGITNESGVTTGSNGIMCADGSTSGLARSIAADSGSAASTWTYLRGTSSPNGVPTSETQVTDGLGNYSDYSFIEASNQPAGTTAAYYETSRAIHNGSSTGPVLLARTTCYNLSSPPSAACSTSPASSLTLPITGIDTYETLDGIQEHGTGAVFDQYGEQTDEYVYDFASAGNRGAVLRHEQWAYGAGIVGLPTSDVVYDGSANVSAKALMSYDTVSPATTSGIPQHVAVSGPRGNLTGESLYTGPGTLSYLSYSATYEDTGDVLTSSGMVGSSSYSYDSTHSFVTQYTPPTPSSGVSLPTQATTDIGTGLPLTATDPNGTKISINPTTEYDLMLRPTEIDAYDSNSNQVAKTRLVYTGFNQTGVLPYQSSTSNGDTETLYDAYGRLSRVAIANGQGSNPWYQQDVCYDANGNATFTSNRYQGNGFGGSAKVCSGNGDTYSYDALGRATKITHSDSTVVNYSHTGRATQLTDENGVSRIVQMDGLGRTTGVCELSSHTDAAGNSPAGCNLDIAGTGFITSYTYSSVNSQPTVTVAQGSQQRVFSTDWLGRSTSVTEPESGTTTYSYSYNNTGLVVTRKRPKANQAIASVLTTTITQYDAVGRVLSISYDDGTPTKNFYYDQANMYGGSVTAGASKGRLTEVSNSIAGNWAGTAYQYDAMGRVTATDECLPSGCGNAAYDKWLTYTYDWTGNLVSASDPASGTISYARSAAGEITSVTNQNYNLTGGSGPTMLVSNLQNGPFGPASWHLANGLTAARYYDSVGNLSSGWVCNGSSAVNCSGGTTLYGFDTTFAGSRLIAMCDSALDQCANTGHDEMGRLTSFTVTAGNPGSYSYTYDRWGNRVSQTLTQGGSGPQPNYHFNNNNQILGFTYDAAGNLTHDGLHSYTYDAEGNITAVDSGNTAQYYYDALNRKVRGQYSFGPLESVFDIAGHITSDWLSPTSANDSRIYWDYGELAYRAVNGTTFFVHRNWVDTDRVHTDPSGATAAVDISLPFGDGGSVTVNEAYGDWDFLHFGSMDYNGETATNHAQFRQYAPTQGAWMSPDPYGGSYDFINPQSLNRYAYVLDDPLSLIDPLGLDVQICDNNNNCVTVSDEEWDLIKDSPGIGITLGNGTIFCQGSTCGSFAYIPGLTGPGTSGPGGGIAAGGAGSGGGGGSGSNNFYTVPGEPYIVCSGAAMYAELEDIKSLTDAKNKQLTNTYGTALALLGPGTAFKYGMGSSVTATGLIQTVLAGVAAKTYFVTLPSWLNGMSQAEKNFKANIQTCKKGG